jgi:hypothetical protein
MPTIASEITKSTDIASHAPVPTNADSETKFCGDYKTSPWTIASDITKSTDIASHAPVPTNADSETKFCGDYKTSPWTRIQPDSSLASLIYKKKTTRQSYKQQK